MLAQERVRDGSTQRCPLTCSAARVGTGKAMRGWSGRPQSPERGEIGEDRPAPGRQERVAGGVGPCARQRRDQRRGRRATCQHARHPPVRRARFSGVPAALRSATARGGSEPRGSHDAGPTGGQVPRRPPRTGSTSWTATPSPKPRPSPKGRDAEGGSSPLGGRNARLEDLGAGGRQRRPRPRGPQCPLTAKSGPALLNTNGAQPQHASQTPNTHAAQR
jgi:hypothetical protein